MPRDGLQRDLDHLTEEVVALGREVEVCLSVTARAIETRDVEAASRRLGSDVRYKKRGARIDEACTILQARQAPVACDLRTILAIRSVAHHLVRAGALCEHACQAVAEETTGVGHALNLEGALSEIARGACDLLRCSVDVFEGRDADRARHLEVADDRVDILYSKIMALASSNGAAVGSPGLCVRAVLIAHYLERIADHGVGIGRSTVFMVTGRRDGTVVRQ